MRALAASAAGDDVTAGAAAATVEPLEADAGGGAVRLMQPEPAIANASTGAAKKAMARTGPRARAPITARNERLGMRTRVGRAVK